MSEKIKAKMVEASWIEKNVFQNVENIIAPDYREINVAPYVLTPEDNGKVIVANMINGYRLSPDSDHDGWPSGSVVYMVVWGFTWDHYTSIHQGTFIAGSGVTLSPYQYTEVNGLFAIAKAERLAADEWEVSIIENGTLTNAD
jgi:hypothetical protein